MRSWGGCHFTYRSIRKSDVRVQGEIALRSKCRTMNRIDRQGREVRAMFDLDDSEIRSRASGSEIRTLMKMYEVKDIITPNTSSIFKQHLHGKPSMVLLQMILFSVTVLLKDCWSIYGLDTLFQGSIYRIPSCHLYRCSITPDTKSLTNAD